MECGRPDESGTIRTIEPLQFNAALRTGFAGKVLSVYVVISKIIRRV